MSPETTLLPKIVESICAVLNSDASEVKPESRLISDLGAESIDFLDISCELEKLLGREIDFKEVVAFTKQQPGNQGSNLSVNDILKYCQAQ